jgi:hypothetical protein
MRSVTTNPFHRAENVAAVGASIARLAALSVGGLLRGLRCYDQPSPFDGVGARADGCRVAVFSLVRTAGQ